MSGSPAAPAPLERPLRFTDCPQQLARRGCQSPGRAVAADYAQLFKAPTPSPRRKSSLGGSHEETACYAAAGPHASLRLPPPPPPPPPPDSSSERGPSERGPEALEPAPVCERPARGWPGFSHRRTPSNVSSASASSQSNVNPSFRLEDESECSPPPPPPPLYAPLGRQQQVCLRGYANASLAMDDEPPAAGLGAPLDRPTWLEMAGGCRLRSSLRRAGRCCGGPAGAASAGPGSGSPGEPTPPGSLAGEDAAHAAPRDGLPPARTRFSPLSYAAEHELLARQPAEGWARRGPPHAPQPQRRPSSDLELEREFFS
ncbi:uncharacterized protein LOC131671431 [Phymastichus coffea]|uniref:uncharacterized protein LOC131671431 n=1 Tax=Phymastichus coffea TaxID=108790 RepID=UPI00273A8B57|nr:uncharacterized protein LOC131671431 [Phymastichus coffea]